LVVASSVQPIFRSRNAEFSKQVATLGCSGPMIFSKIASARYRNPVGNPNPTLERWPPPGSQPWRVARDDGLKRRQRAQKPCDRASKYADRWSFRLNAYGSSTRAPRAWREGLQPGSNSRKDVRKVSLGTWESLRSPLRIGQTKDGTGLPTSRHPRDDLAAFGERTR
jgi:hypothetical protein